jgi:predicted SAM-dependent methyltransferase
MAGQYVQYGCGWSAPDGWLNFDCSPTLKFERLPLIGRLYTRNVGRFPAAVRIGDIVKGLPIGKGSCDGIYCSHVLEHLCLEDFHVALQRTYEYLKPGGTFRFVLPDLNYLARTYLNDPNSNAASEFMIHSALGQKTRFRGLRGMLRSWLGNSSHLWMWDDKAMRAELEKQGFKNIRRAAFNDSEDPMFKLAEHPDRFGEKNLAMECRK